MRQVILERAWSNKRQTFVESFDGEFLDAGVLLMTEVGFIDAKRPAHGFDHETTGASSRSRSAHDAL